MNKAKKNIVIVGGGTAGWISAAMLAKQHGGSKNSNVSITLIESDQISTIGVGEGTFPTMRKTLRTIGISETEFEAMHPRFTAVNMYRKMCEREKIEFKQNKTVDNIGVILEKPYDDARTK